MLRRYATAAVFALALAAGPAAAQNAPAAVRPAAEPPGAGEQLARTVTLVTGVPISPLLGVSTYGAWRWVRTPEPLRRALPPYCRPWFWAPGLALALLFALNTTIGGLVPGLKKPMDFVEEHENKFSALIASPIVLIEVERMLAAAGLLPDDALGGPVATGAAALAGADLLGALAAVGTGALYLTVFAVVFLAFHAVQVLIALSPSTLLDLGLRGFRFAMLAATAAAAAVHPYVGAAYGLLILAGCWLIAGWSFRLTVFGSVFSWEILTGRDGSADAGSAPLVVFAGRGLGPPVRTRGRLEPAPGGGWRFRWRPWLVLPARSVELGPASALAVMRGALSPRLLRTAPVRETTLARFPPRFRGREEPLALRLGVAEVRDGRVVRGLTATWRWLRAWLVGSEPGDAEPPVRA